VCNVSTAVAVATALLIFLLLFLDVLQLSPEYRHAEPGMFNLLFGGESVRHAPAAISESWMRTSYVAALFAVMMLPLLCCCSYLPWLRSDSCARHIQRYLSRSA
jgi:hypothetical protein